MGCSRIRRTCFLLLPKIILSHAEADGNALRNQIFLTQYGCICSWISEFMLKHIFTELTLCWSLRLESIWCVFKHSRISIHFLKCEMELADSDTVMTDTSMMLVFTCFGHIMTHITKIYLGKKITVPFSFVWDITVVRCLQIAGELT